MRMDLVAVREVIEKARCMARTGTAGDTAKIPVYNPSGQTVGQIDITINRTSVLITLKSADRPPDAVGDGVSMPIDDLLAEHGGSPIAAAEMVLARSVLPDQPSICAHQPPDFDGVYTS